MAAAIPASSDGGSMGFSFLTAVLPFGGPHRHGDDGSKQDGNGTAVEEEVNMNDRRPAP